MKSFLCWLVLLSLLAAHLFVAIAPGNRIYTQWSGGGDTRQYVELAENISAGRGYTFAGMPTALRAPLYPLLLAGLMRLSQNWAIWIRVLQLVAGIVTAILCGELADRWFGANAGVAGMVLALLSPTLLFFAGEILTESLAALLVVGFLLVLDSATRSESTDHLVTLGVLAGVAALCRFNTIALVPIALLTVFLSDRKNWKRATIVGMASLVILAPWIVHNEIVFHGRASYSTHGGLVAVEGVLMPEGRTQPGETEAILNALGLHSWNVETNTPKGQELRDEAALNEKAWHVAFHLWRETGLRLFPLWVNKIGAFWLSTDQIVGTGGLSSRARALRLVGSGIYLIILISALFGWRVLYRRDRKMAHVIVFYAAALTIFHLPLTMNTRLRVPLFDPLLCSLAAGGAYNHRAWFLPRSATSASVNKS